MAEPKAIIAAQTAAATKELFVRANRYGPVSFHAPGLATTETVIFQARDAAGTGWEDLEEAGSTIQLDANTNHVALYSPLHLRISKSSTAANVAVYFHDGSEA